MPNVPPSRAARGAEVTDLPPPRPAAAGLPPPANPAPHARGAFRLGGSFADPALERGFRRDIWPEWSQRLAMITLLGTGVFQVFSVSDYLTLGLVPLLAVCVGARALVLAGAIGVARQVRRGVAIERVERSTLALMLLLPTVVFLIVSIHQRGISYEIPGLILMTLCYYLFLPLPLWALGFASAYAGAGFLAVSALALAPSPTALTLSALELLMCNVLGLYAARHAGVMRRRQWLSLVELQRRAEFEDLIARQSTRFISLPISQIGDGIQDAIAELSGFANADRSYVYEYNLVERYSICTHEWCAPGIDEGLIKMQRLPMDDYPWSADQLQRGNIICIKSLDELPPAAAKEKEACGMLSVRSMLVVPLFFEDRLSGAVGFHTVREDQEWDPVLVSLLRMVGEMIVGAWVRRQVGLELRDRNLALESSVAALEKSNAELQQFAYVASHDLKEPLRVISSFSSLLAQRYRNRLDQDADEYIGYLTTAAARMHAMITDLLEYSRVQHKARPFTVCDTAAVLDQALDNLRLSVQELNAEVEVGELPHVEGDPGQIMQLFQNLVGNALKFHDGHAPKVRISARAMGGGWEFSVADNGIGVEAKHAERIFQVFTRLNNGDQYPGSGIGLAVCKRIVERHRGRIWVQPNQPRGSDFRFTLDAAG